MNMQLSALDTHCPPQATLATDNTLRVYDCLETASGVQWELREELDMTSPSFANLSVPVSSTAGSDTGSTGASWVSAAKASRPSALTSSGSPSSLGTSESANSLGASGIVHGADGSWSLSWCKETYWGPLIAVVAQSGSRVAATASSVVRVRNTANC